MVFVTWRCTLQKSQKATVPCPHGLERKKVFWFHFILETFFWNRIDSLHRSAQHNTRGIAFSHSNTLATLFFWSPMASEEQLSAIKVCILLLEAQNTIFSPQFSFLRVFIFLANDRIVWHYLARESAHGWCRWYWLRASENPRAFRLSRRTHREFCKTLSSEVFGLAFFKYLQRGIIGLALWLL